ncbi:hypothetical protein [Rhodoblastus sphagnicola]|nr:hypothetical protein [Rhodoblastus sphagnicola]
MTNELLAGLGQQPLPPQPTREEVVQIIDEVRKAFGAPGDWGYGTSKGDSLLRLYTVARLLSRPVVAADSEAANA